MRKPEQSAEPSIEEILASIRKIIADDGAHSARAETFSEKPAPEAASRRRDAEPSRRALSQPVTAFYPEPQEPAAAMGEDDILELTEDSMVEDNGGQGGMTFADAATPADARQPEPMQAGMVGGSRSAPPSGEELESVFSSVVAEVQRLSGGSKPAATAASLHDWPEPAAMPPRAPRQPPVAEPWDNAAAKREEEPLPRAPVTQAPAPAARSPQPPSRPASKPVWSARHLDSEGPRVRAPQPSGDKPAGQPAPVARGKLAGQQAWTEGVQMPVPEGGPATPFPEVDLDESDTAPPLSGSGESQSEIEKEKTFVGEMLTRVFGGAQKKAPDMPAPPAPRQTPPQADPRLTKAEDLAKATITDFASDKLRAPSVAQALHADRPFMETITDSLAAAMAEAKADRDAGPIVPRTAPPPTDDELPEALIPPDTEIESFGAPPLQSSGFPAHGVPGSLSAREPAAAAPPRTSPFAELPELPRNHSGDIYAESGQGMRQTHSEIFGSSGPESGRDVPPAMPTRTPPKPELAAMLKPAAAPTDNTATTGIAFPAGLEDSIKELIKPLIVQWLNDNLPRIVEKAVREEITDQGLVSRARGEGGSRH
jgi:cell pole-organizing protein PopZ